MCLQEDINGVSTFCWRSGMHGKAWVAADVVTCEAPSHEKSRRYPMTRLFSLGALAVAAALVLAACGGSSTSSSSGSGSAAGYGATASSSPSSSGAAPVVSTKTGPLGTFLVDGNGR